MKSYHEHLSTPKRSNLLMNANLDYARLPLACDANLITLSKSATKA